MSYPRILRRKTAKSQSESEDSIISSIKKHGLSLLNIRSRNLELCKMLESDLGKYVADGRDASIAKCENDEKEVRLRISKEKEETKKLYEIDTADATQVYSEAITAINTNLAEIQKEHNEEWINWSDPYWNTKYKPIKKIERPPLTRFGEITLNGKNDSINIPALLRIITSKNVLINASGHHKSTALVILQCLMLRLLVTIPAGKVRFTLIDPVGLGSNMASFMHLPEDLVGGKIWTEANHIEQELTDLSVYMEAIIQKYLRNNFPSMEDYNNKAGEVAEPYRFLVIANFPTNFTESAAQRLISIASNGPRTGVYVLAMRDTQQNLPYNFKIEQLASLSTTIEHEGGHFVWDDEFFKDKRILFDELPDVGIFNDLLKVIGEESKSASVVQVPFRVAVNGVDQLWEMKSDEGLSVPIGRAGARELQYFNLGKNTLQHVLIAGKTGSGKSNLLHVMIMSLCLHYSPEELELYLIDFKKGIEFKPYAKLRLPHARVIAIQSEREFGISVLQGLDAELQRRGDLFRDSEVQSLKEFREKNTNAHMPRIVLLVDEFQEFFTEDDTIAGMASLLFDRLVRQGRAFGIHVILASQALAGAYTISRSTTDQMAVRIALQCSDADSRLILGDDNPNARLLVRPGEAIYNDANGLIKGNNLFQVLFLSDKDRDEHLNCLQQLYATHQLSRKNSQIIFEGNAPASIENNQLLTNILDAPSWQCTPHRLYAWLGEPIAIKHHTSAEFRRQSRSNLLIVGQNEESGSSMLICALIALAAQASPDAMEFHFINLSKSESDWNTVINSLPGLLPHQFNTYSKRHIPDAMKKLTEILIEREEAAGEKVGKNVFLFIMGIQRARELKSDDGYTLSEPTEKLVRILSNGPDCGIHTICWGDTYKNIERILGRNISEFDLRVAMQMTISESNDIIDSPDANKLGQYRSFFYDEERTGTLEKFRPYALPSIDWFVNNSNKMKHRKIWKE